MKTMIVLGLTAAFAASLVVEPPAEARTRSHGVHASRAHKPRAPRKASRSARIHRARTN